MRKAVGDSNAMIEPGIGGTRQADTCSVSLVSFSQDHQAGGATMRPIDAILDKYDKAKQAAPNDRERLSIARRCLRDAQQGMFVIRGRTDAELGAAMFPWLVQKTVGKEAEDDGSVQHVYLSPWGSIDTKWLNAELVTFFQADVDYLWAEDDSLQKQSVNVKQANREPPSAKKPLQEEWLQGKEKVFHYLLIRLLTPGGFTTQSSADQWKEIFEGHFSNPARECTGPKIDWQRSIAAYKWLFGCFRELHEQRQLTLTNDIGLFWEAHFVHKGRSTRRDQIHNDHGVATLSDRTALAEIITELRPKLQ
jgi:hypothetical protein